MSKKIYTIVSRGFCSSGACFWVLLIVMMLLGSCWDESLTTMHPGPEISFSLSDATVRPITRTGGDREDTDMVVVDSLLGVLPLQTEDGGRELYLHAFLSGSDRAGEGRVLTRAAPVDGMGFYDSFGVLASVYSGAWDESSCFPDYMYNVMVTKSSSWTTSYYWPGGGRNVRFFAYAPYNWEGIVLSGKDVAGTPTITCSLPDDVPDQKDLLVAVSGEMPGNTSSTAPLNFRHVLTAVRFVTGDDMLPGRITKITLKNVYGKAVYPVGGTSWRDFGSVKSFSQTPDKEVSGQPGEEITGGVTTFMMIPQHLPAGASIEIAYTDGLSSTPRTLSTSIAGKIWPMGKTITYRISTTSISVVPEFSVTSSGNFTHEGGAVNYTVRSFATVSGEDGSSQKVEMKWSAEFVEEDGVGGYHAISRPFWFTGFTESGNGGVSQHRATAEAQQGVTENPHNSKLQIAEDINVQTGKTPYNLSNSSGEEAVENTANCYLVNAPGIYSLPLVYGNGIKNGNFNTPAYNKPHFRNHLDKQISNPYIYNNSQCNPTDAILLWQDEENLVTEVWLSADKKRLEFKVDRSAIRQGNAVVAVRGKGEVMWSWHIWCTNLPADQVYMANKYGNSYTFMDRSLGATSALDDTGSLGMSYQWGRKDPIPGSSKFYDMTEPTLYGSVTKVSVAASDASTGTIANAIQNPVTFLKAADWLFAGRNNYLWGNPQGEEELTATHQKSIYDPCPPGYRIPGKDAFSIFTKTGENTTDPAQHNVVNTSPTKRGWYLYYAATGSGEQAWFPYNGCRYYSSGALNRGSFYYYWTSAPSAGTKSCCLAFKNDWKEVDPLYTFQRGNAQTIRCVKE